MSNKIFCASLEGTQTKIVEIEAAFTRGLPNFSITGLATSSIQESKQRVQSALANCNFTLPPLKITINLAPSDIAKSGSYFDLPIALVLRADSRTNTNNQQDIHDLDSQNTTTNASQQGEFDGWFAFGELGLDGDIKYTQSIYPLLFDIALTHKGANVIVPQCAREILEVIPNLRLHFAPNLQDAIEILTSPMPKQPQEQADIDLGFKSIEVSGERYFYAMDFDKDFSEVKNQEIAKRAALIAATGFHNIIFEGSPGCGKSMIANRMRYILPPISLKEMMQNLKLQSLNAQDCLYSPLRPFRNPHQSASKASILGSATQYEPKPGEIALAHNGILFFDELPHFKRDILESLREPLENNKMTISRVHSKLEYDTAFLFIGAQNPCPCGNLLSQSKECRCQDKDIVAYKNRLSEPFLDRIDMFIQMNESVSSEDSKAQECLDSTQMQNLVFSAFKFAKQRGQEHFNGKLNEREIEKFCTLDDEAKSLLVQASQRFALSQRAQDKLKKVARTIADLDSSEIVAKKHLLQALSYRKMW